jgi:stage II sporulation protein D
MRRVSLLVAVLAALSFASSAAASPLIVVWGRGWGHGIGMSQWGAFGLASGFKVDHPYTHQEILGHYYTGTTVTTRPTSSVGILLASGRASVHIGSASAFTVGAKTHAAGDPLVTPTATGRIKVEGLAGTFVSPVTVSPGSSALALNGARYRGKLVVSVSGGRLRVVNRVNIEGYLKGVVPRESPSSWPLEALKAQAVAARSYALTSSGKCGGFLCPDTRDQVYGGLDGEAASTNAAVDQTAGEVVDYGGAVAQTFFSSSSGGQTATPKDGFGPGAGDVPYLQSVADPADVNGTNPNHFWKHAYTAGAFGRALGTGVARDVTVIRNGSGRAGTVNVVTAGGTTGRSGFSVRSSLGLRSTRFWVVVTNVTPAPNRSACKKSVTINVFARGVANATLQQKAVTGSSWTAVPLTRVDATHMQATRRPCVSVDYRLVTAYATGNRVHHPVFPNIAFNATQNSTSLRGAVNPLLPGNTVAIQRHASAGWTTVATTTIRSDGTFRANFNVVAGDYRARVRPAASTGLVAGYSPVLHVVTG